jgi:hypothetical protein
MISKSANRALELITGLEVCRQTDERFWMGLVTRIILDMDDGADERGLAFVADLLKDMWNKLPEAKPSDEAEPIMRVGRTLSQTPGLCTLYRVTGDDWKAHECIGITATPEIAEAICEAVNAGHPAARS